MDKDTIKGLVKLYYRRIKKALHQSISSDDPETLHQFRVNYKKLRAFLRMISGDKKTTALKMPVPLKACYHFAGVIRDMQLQQLRITDACRQQPVQPIAYYCLLQKKIDKIKPLLVSATQQFSIKKEKDKLVREIQRGFSLKRYNAYNIVRAESIHSVVAAGRLDDKHIHAIRKMLKDLYYNGKLFKQDARLDAVAVFLNELGNLLDKNIALSLLSSKWLQTLSAGEQQLLRNICKVWRNEKKVMRRSITTKLTTANKSGNCFLTPAVLPVGS